jgi:hypothetical protein
VACAGSAALAAGGLGRRRRSLTLDTVSPPSRSAAAMESGTSARFLLGLRSRLEATSELAN